MFRQPPGTVRTPNCNTSMKPGQLDHHDRQAALAAERIYLAHSRTHSRV